jgi:hypothetical protein
MASPTRTYVVASLAGSGPAWGQSTEKVTDIVSEDSWRNLREDLASVSWLSSVTVDCHASS